MMNIYQKIKSYFYSENQSQNLPNNYIMLSLDDHNNDPHIKVVISDLSDLSCEKYAEMIFDLNKGLYYQSIIDLLLRMSKEDKDIGKYIESLIIYLGILTQKHSLSTSKFDNKNSPMIMPTEFNKYVTHK